MIRNFSKLFPALLLLSVALPAYAQDKEMTVDDVRKSATKSMTELVPVDTNNALFYNALVSTYEKNPRLKAARAQTRAVFEQLPQADAGWRPTVGAEAKITYSDINTEAKGAAAAFTTDGSNTGKDAALTLSQPLYSGGSTQADVNAAKNTIKAQIANLDLTEQEVLLSAATVYLNVLRDEALLKLTLNNKDVLSRQSDATHQRFEVGELTRTDVSQAEARSAKADAEVITAQGNLKSSRARFEQIIGYQPEQLGFPTLPLDIPTSLDEAVNFAEKWNPGVRAAQYAQQAAQYDVHSIYGELLPSLSIAGRAEKAYEPSVGIDNQDASSIGLVASVPLYEGGATRSRVRQAKQTANQRMEEIAQAQRATREAVVSAWETLAATKAEKEARKSQVEAAEVARFGVKQEADLGARTILDTLDADQELLDAKVALVEAARDEMVALYTLAAAMGIFDPKNLGFGDKIPDYNKEVEDVRGKVFSTSIAPSGGK